MISLKGKKLTCLLLAFGLACTGIQITANAAGKTKLITKCMNLKTGQSKKISIQGKKKKATYLFTSSSTKKATVSKSGIVKAKKPGNVIITVKEKYKKKTTKLGKVKVVIKQNGNNSATKTPATTATTVPTATPEAPTAAPTAAPTVAPTATATVAPTATANTTATPAPTATPSAENSDYDVPVGFRSKNAANAGTVKDISYESTVIVEGKSVTRKAKVVLPKGYTTEKKYPVVYMLHGIFGDETSLYGDGTQNVIWNAIANGDAEEMIVVFPNACANEAGKGEGFNLEHYAAYDNFINDLSKCLMPYINENFSTLTGRENTAICGFSMGGRVSLQIGFTKQEDFGYVGGFCPAFGIFKYTNYGVTEPGFFTEDTFTLKPEYMNNTLVLIAAGPRDDIVKTEPKRYANALAKNKVPHIYYETMGGDSANVGGGGHESAVYQHGAYNFLKRIFKGSIDVPPVEDNDKDNENESKETSLDMSKADTAVLDGAGVKAEPDSTTNCLNITLPQFQGIIFKNTSANANNYKKVTITYKSDSTVSTYLFDADLTDGIGQTPSGQHQVNALPAADSFQTVTFEVQSEFSGSCITAIKLVHVDFENAGDKHMEIKSITFSK